MAEIKQVTVKLLAASVKKDPEELLQTMHEAGLLEIKSIDDTVSVIQKMTLLRHLKQKKSKPTQVVPPPSGAKSSRVGGVNVQVKTSRQTKQFIEAADPEEEQTSLRELQEDAQVQNAQEGSEANYVEEVDNTESAQSEVRRPESESSDTVSEKRASKKIEELDVYSDKEETEKKRKSGIRKQRSKDNIRRQMEEAISSMDDNDDDDDDDDGLMTASKRSFKSPSTKVSVKKKSRSASSSLIKQSFSKPTSSAAKEITISSSLTVAELANKMSVKSSEVIKRLMGMGVMAAINEAIDQDTAILVIEEMGHTVKLVSQTAVEEALMAELEGGLSQELVSCPPVVTIMGHVDHGKTSLLDTIRRSQVTSLEAGGITQHIGAYHVNTDKGTICFLDTPGHAAFAAMRARGANCTDIVVLVVAADDGVMPQTIEAIQHAKAAKVPLLVAVNKIDKPEADVERIMSELSQHDVISEAWGGDTIFQSISAKTGEGVDALLDAILLQAEVLELSAPVAGLAKGVVIESRLDKGRGPVATVLISSGTLHTGDIVLAGREYGRVRAMIGDNGQKREEAGPTVPVEILGLSNTPEAGDEFWAVKDERRAREVAVDRQKRYRQERMVRQKAANLDSLFENITKNKCAVLNVILKSDVQGSTEAIADALQKLSTDEVKVNLVSAGVGGLNESDIHLAIASSAVVIGFNVRANLAARTLVEKEGVDLRYYSIIYNLIDEVRAALSGMLSPDIQEKIIGMAEVRDVFRSSKLGAVAGCMVIEGILKRNAPIRVLRNDVVIYEGELESLRRFKENAMEVTHGKECGIGVKNYNDVKVGDVIEAFERIEVKREL